jgi:hypothetical protein
MRVLLLSSILLVSLTMGCDEEKPDEDERIEGTEPDDCTDLADNDADGLFDCDDDGGGDGDWEWGDGYEGDYTNWHADQPHGCEYAFMDVSTEGYGWVATGGSGYNTILCVAR